MLRSCLIGLMLLLGLGVAPGARAADLLPDLVSDPPDGSVLEVHDYGNGQHELLLRFNGYVHNAGQGALDVRGTHGASDPPETMTPHQRVYNSNGGFRDDPMPRAQLIYVRADGHNHWHLQNVARYSLWNAAQTQQVAPAMKVGFCLDDSEHVNLDRGPAGGVYTDGNGRAFCKQGHPEATDLFEGISAGWRDLYSSNLTYQWVLASDVQPGDYLLREDVDTDDIVHESNETNAPAYAASTTTIPGYVANGVAAGTGLYGQPQQVTLDAAKFGSPGALNFKVVKAPAHGTLDQTAGSAFAGPTLTYTPASGYSGPDSFTYVALDAASEFPRHPAAATVTLSVGAPIPSVAIDGAPSSIETGHGVQLHATVSNDADGVVWSVDGVDGGSAASGTIGPNGFYTAPATVPPAGHVTIGARSLSGAHDERTVAITEDLPSPPAPDPPAPPPSKPGSPLGPLAVGLAHNVVVARVTPRRAGRVILVGKVGKRTLGTCRGRLAARQRFSCRMRVPRHVNLRKLTVSAWLTDSAGKVLAKRTISGRPRKLYG